MKIIPLTQGKEALVDDKDYDRLSQWKWYAHRRSDFWYAERQVRVTPNKQRALKMHREIMLTPKGMMTDHINHDGLDNRRANLRVCSHAQNMQNSRSAKNSSSLYKGVSFDKKSGKWDVRIHIDGGQCFLGRFHCELDAAEVYDNKAREEYGEFACTNFKESLSCV